jgi:hypothetical protein
MPASASLRQAFCFSGWRVFARVGLKVVFVSQIYRMLCPDVVAPSRATE